MKTSYLYLLPLSMLLAACTDGSEPPEPSEGYAIAFRANSGANSRAAIETTNELENFNVWGWTTDCNDICTRVFNSQIVTNNYPYWTYTPPIYWMPNHEYHFLAVATNKGHDSGLRHSVPERFTSWEKADTMRLTLSEPYDEDILYATKECFTTSIVNTPPPVDLTFLHLLARLQVQVRASTITNCSIRLRSLTFKPTYNAARFHPAVIETVTEIPPANPTAQPQYVTSQYIRCKIDSLGLATRSYVLLDDKPAGHALPYDAPYMYLLPAEAGTFLVNYELWQNSTSWDRPPVLLHTYNDEFRISGSLWPGHSYVATITLPSATSVVSLDVSLEPWGEDNDNDREILSI